MKKVLFLLLIIAVTSSQSSLFAQNNKKARVDVFLKQLMRNYGKDSSNLTNMKKIKPNKFHKKWLSPPNRLESF